MKNKKIILITSAVVLIVGLVYFFFYDTNEGKIYASKQTLCRQFAQSYLRTIQKTDNITDFGSEKWQMAIDVETEFYNMCLLDLNKESLNNYKPSALEKYKN